MCVEQGVELSMCSQSQGWAGEMMQAKMRIDCFLEYECIKPEMTEGKRTSFQGFINIHANSNNSTTSPDTAGIETNDTAARLLCGLICWLPTLKEAAITP